MVPSLTSYDLSQIGGLKYNPLDQLRDTCRHLANMIDDIDKAAMCCASCCIL